MQHIHSSARSPRRVQAQEALRATAAERAEREAGEDRLLALLQAACVRVFPPPPPPAAADADDALDGLLH